MPSTVGAWIRTEKGIRRVSLEETSRGLGLPKDTGVKITAPLLEQTTSLFHWEYLSASLLTTKKETTSPSPADASGPRAKNEPLRKQSKEPDTAFTWTPPDLSVGGEWYLARLANLKKAASSLPDPAKIIQDGLEILHIHRGNYSTTGPAPSQLQLIWWEFPPEHWTALREGSRMNFLVQPEAKDNPNAPMDQEQLDVAAAFVDELLALGVLLTAEDGLEILLNAPLFVVPKEGQEGEWRVIADMLRGGQNSCMGSDPVFLPRQGHILDQMYQGGYSAVVDASKFFYQFNTHPDDRPYLGLKHPITGVLYAYGGLPMGGSSSPCLAGRYGLSLLRLLRERCKLFQGKGRANCWWTGFSEIGFDPALGYGFVLESADGPAVKIWVWVDDFILHGPTEEKTTAALHFFLDTTVDIGMLCHPKKLTPPCQVVKYCGFLFDTTDIPCLRIPITKRERALAIVKHLINSPAHRRWSRLSLAVAAGILESLVEATPRRIGHTHLRRFHSLVHPPGIGSGAEPYYTTTPVPAEVRRDLRWWVTYLETGEGKFARSTASATLIPTFGDGSGTGTGGTYAIPDGPLKMWKGKWSPFVYQFSSNWKELATLRLTLDRLLEEDPHSVKGTTVFYFTDNSTVYWIAASGSSASPRLHALIEDIRLLEMKLGCHLQVIHVPGLVMIQQGTDGLSRGIWMTSLQGLEDSRRLTQAVFDPVPYDPDLIIPYLQNLHDRGYPCSNWRYCDWQQPWNPSRLFDRLSVWFPPPEVARQVITFVLETWVEKPATTSALFFIPRTVPAFWRGLSRHLIELDTIFPHLVPLRLPPLLPIPIIVLYLPAHQRSLPTRDRLAFAPLPPGAHWHREQAAQLRGLPPEPLPQP